MESKRPRNTDDSILVVRVGLYSFLVNLFLTLLKAALVYFSGSLAIVASAVDSVTDTVASLAVWVGLKLSTRKSRKFPFGLYKIENIIQVVLALFIFIAGYEISRQMIQPEDKAPVITTLVVIGTAVGIVAPLVFGWYTIVIGRRTGSPALIADGRHRQADVLSTLVVFVAVLLDYMEIPGISFHGLTVDRIAAGLILIFIGYAGWGLLVDGMRVLLDVSVGHETLGKVKTIVESEPAVANVLSVTGRSAGRYRFLELQVELRISDLEKAHAVSDRIEEKIRNQVRNVDRVLIHYEPRRRDMTVVAVGLESDGMTVSEHFGESPLFYLGTLKQPGGNVLEQRFVPNPFYDEPKGKGIKVAKWLLKQGVDQVYTSRSIEGKGPGYVLSDAGVQVAVSGYHSLPEILNVACAYTGEDLELP
jgi:cation diffusion facilitator family transporter